MLLRLFVPLLACASAWGQFTLPQALSSAFPSEIKAAPRGQRVAWVVDWQGVRNIWTAAGPEFKGRALTRYTAADGQELSGLEWSPAGDRLYFVRGGSTSRSGESPNPTSDVKGAEQAVYTIAFDGGDPVRIGDGSAPLASPKGDRVVWLRGGQVWSAPAAGGKAVQLFKARGSQGALAFSPGGGLLAFSSARTDHAFIGIYDFAAQAVRWIDPSVDRDSAPAWSPEGKRIAYLRVPYERPVTRVGPRRAGQPWSIRVADLSTGAAREIFRADEGRGSVPVGVLDAAPLTWMASDDIVFPWEKTGWKLLHAVSAAGGAARLLTPGEFEVETVNVAPGGRSLVISTNQGDRDRRHLWRVAPGAAPQLLTPGQGIEWAPQAFEDGETIAFLCSDAQRPARAAVRLPDGKTRELAPELVPAGFPAGLIAPQAVQFAATDGLQVPAQIFLPRDLKPGERRPAVVFYHGGSRRQMLLGWHPMYYYHNAYAFNQYLASRGYIVLSVNYRSGTGYGMEFREALHYGVSGASEYHDVAGAALYLRSRADVDPARIAAWGGSYGGYLAALALARGSDLYAAGVDLHGVHEWSRDMNETTYAGQRLPDEIQRRAYESSPMAFLDGWRSPVLLIHGDDDRDVIFNQTVMLVEGLRQRGVEFEQLIFPDEVHDFLLHANWLRAYAAAGDFLDRKIGPRATR